jgi:hypothetical protein
MRYPRRKLPRIGAYLLRVVLHDWDDQEALSILKACRRVMTDAARLLIIEEILAPPNEGLAGKFADLNILVARADASEPAMSFPTCVLLRGLS